MCCYIDTHKQCIYIYIERERDIHIHLHIILYNGGAARGMLIQPRAERWFDLILCAVLCFFVV